MNEPIAAPTPNVPSLGADESDRAAVAVRARDSRRAQIALVVVSPLRHAPDHRGSVVAGRHANRPHNKSRPIRVWIDTPSGIALDRLRAGDAPILSACGREQHAKRAQRRDGNPAGSLPGSDCAAH